jgi:two-component system nitrate/nitrite response regulator NarL
VKVVICDPHRMFADALASVVDSRIWTIVDTPVDPAHAVAVVAQTHVDVCLMELVFPDGMTSVAAIAAIRDVSPATKVVVLTACSDPELIMSAVQSGADGIVFKDDEIDRIIEVCEQIVSSTHETEGALENCSAPANVTRPPTGTSERGEPHARPVSGLELEMLDRLLRGERGQALAYELGISYSSTRSRIRQVLARLGARSELEAVALAIDEDPRHDGP